MMSRLRLSIIVVFHAMAREAPRTLFTLSAAYQRGVTPADYEVIVVDAGSPSPLPADLVSQHGPNFRLLRTPPAPSPAAAVNLAARAATGQAIALCIDGARMLSPGIVAGMLGGLRMFDDPVVATLAWHLGPKGQNESILEGYDQAVEDRLLATVDWRTDGYDLFRVAALSASSARGWFAPLNESNCLAVTRSAWEELGGARRAVSVTGWRPRQSRLLSPGLRPGVGTGDPRRRGHVPSGARRRGHERAAGAAPLAGVSRRVSGDPWHGLRGPSPRGRLHRPVDLPVAALPRAERGGRPDAAAPRVMRAANTRPTSACPPGGRSPPARPESRSRGRARG